LLAYFQAGVDGVFIDHPDIAYKLKGQTINSWYSTGALGAFAIATASLGYFFGVRKSKKL
jgi:hypothetical protein